MPCLLLTRSFFFHLPEFTLTPHRSELGEPEHVKLNKGKQSRGEVRPSMACVGPLRLDSVRRCLLPASRTRNPGIVSPVIYSLTSVCKWSRVGESGSRANATVWWDLGLGTASARCGLLGPHETAQGGERRRRGRWPLSLSLGLSPDTGSEPFPTSASSRN